MGCQNICKESYPRMLNILIYVTTKADICFRANSKAFLLKMIDSLCTLPPIFINIPEKLAGKVRKKNILGLVINIILERIDLGLYLLQILLLNVLLRKKTRLATENLCLLVRPRS